MHIHQTGAGEIPLILLHGWGNSRKIWQHLHDSIKSERLISYDLKGFGDAEKPQEKEAYSLNAYVEELLAVYEMQKISKAVLTGTSMGAVVACHFAAKYPEKVAKLVIISGPVLGKRIMSFVQKLPIYIPSLTNLVKKDKKRVEKYFKKIVVNKDSIPDYFYDDLLNMGEAACKYSIEGFGAYDPAPFFVNTHIPLVYLAGDRWDDNFSLKQINMLAEMVKNFTWELLPGCHHYPMIENPKALLETLRKLGVC